MPLTAYDDQTSTFIVPEGGGFGVVFCPTGRSSNILATLGSELRSIASQGYVSPLQLSLLRNTSYIDSLTSAASGWRAGGREQPAAIILAVVVVVLTALW